MAFINATEPAPQAIARFRQPERPVQWSQSKGVLSPAQRSVRAGARKATSYQFLQASVVEERGTRGDSAQPKVCCREKSKERLGGIVMWRAWGRLPSNTCARNSSARRVLLGDRRTLHVNDGLLVRLRGSLKLD
jgi:hypothetical protein